MGLALGNLDGDLDVVAAKGFEHPNGRVLWAGNLDGDGDVEIVTAEMGTSTGYGDNDSNFIVLEGLDPAGTS